MAHMVTVTDEAQEAVLVSKRFAQSYTEHILDV